MIVQYLEKLSARKIILASSSPRRKEIIEKLGINASVIPSTYEENLNPSDFSHPSQYVIETARGKAEEVSDRLVTNGSGFDLIIGADTCVTLDGNVFGKPKSEKDGIDMLSKLSGKIHEVITGVCLISRRPSGSLDVSEFYETTTVSFATLQPSLIEAYVKTKEPMDKAGAYGIQALGGTLIDSIQGDYYNVMGFPLHRFTSKLLPIIDKWNLS